MTSHVWLVWSIQIEEKVVFQDLSSEHVLEDNRLELRFLMTAEYSPDEKLGYVGLGTMFGCP